jgi:penicillin V acylase-like amidase (Ntn superfamily)
VVARADTGLLRSDAQDYGDGEIMLSKRLSKIASAAALALVATMATAQTASAATVIDYDGKRCTFQVAGYMSMNANLLGARNHRWVVNGQSAINEFPYTSSWRSDYSQWLGTNNSSYNSAYGSLGANSLQIYCR